MTETKSTKAGERTQTEGWAEVIRPTTQKHSANAGNTDSTNVESHKETRHTPGPWYYSGASSREGEIRAQYVDETGSVHNEPVCVIETRISSKREANARLIAAAPELLEALRGMLLLNVVSSIEVIGGPLNSGAFQKVQAARAAIAKAEGKA